MQEHPSKIVQNLVTFMKTFFHLQLFQKVFDSLSVCFRSRALYVTNMAETVLLHYLIRRPAKGPRITLLIAIDDKAFD